MDCDTCKIPMRLQRERSRWCPFRYGGRAILRTWACPACGRIRKTVWMKDLFARLRAQA